MPQRVIHPTNRTLANSSLANFKVQQASRIKRSISTTLVIIQRATTGTTFRKGSWQRNKPQYRAQVRTYGNPPAYGHTPQSGNWNQLSCSSIPGSCDGNKQITPDVVPKPKCSDVPGSCHGNRQVTPDVTPKPKCSGVPGSYYGNKLISRPKCSNVSGSCDGSKQATPDVSQNQSVPASLVPATETSK